MGETTDDHMNCVCQLKQRNIDTYLCEPLELFPKLENSYFFLIILPCFDIRSLSLLYNAMDKKHNLVHVPF